MANSTNKITQLTSATGPGKSSGISFDSFGSISNSDSVNNWISGNSDKTNLLFDPSLDTSSSYFGTDYATTALGDIDDKLRKFDITSGIASQGQVADTNTLKPQDIQRLIQESRQQTANQILEENKFAVRLVSVANGDKVVFKSSPTSISESRMAVYRPIDVMHLPGNYSVYSHTNPRNWAVIVKLFSRNPVEAEENLATLTMLKSWMLPYFGKSKTAGVGAQINSSAYNAEMLGAPPEVLRFTAYSDPTKSGLSNIRNVPIILQSMDSSYTDEVDYIQTSVSKVPFPALMSINMTLVEVHSPNEYKNFNIVDYKNGNLKSW